MAFDGKLIFIRPHDGTGRLIFGDDSEVVIQPTEIGVDAQFEGDMACTVQLLWDANVSRGEAVELRSHWQAAEPASARAAAHWQPAQAITARTSSRWQSGAAVSGQTETRWQNSQPHNARTGLHWQDAAGARHTLLAAWQEAQRLRGTTGLRWQDGQALRETLLARYQEAIRLRSVALSTWQDATPSRTLVRHRGRDGLPVRLGFALHWQDARRPPPGLSIVTPVTPPTEEPCYDPATLGRLEFIEAWAPDGRLVFVCKTPDLPPAAVVIPIKAIYMTYNNLTLKRVAGNVPLPALGISLSIDDNSFTWAWSANFAGTREVADVMAALDPDSGDPVEVELSINGVAYRLLTDPIDRQRQFARSTLRVPGRGLAAELDSPSARQMVFSQASPRTAQQLANEALQVNGVGIGWDVDWGLTDWLVPGGVWSHQGTHRTAVSEIAAAAGGYVQPHRTARTLRVLPRYPAPPWEWSALTPDIELPSGPVVVEGIEWQRLPDYNRVYVQGEGQGVRGQVTRAGTAGDVDAPMFVHPLITAADAARQAGTNILSKTGKQALVTLRLPVLDETGVILPGKLVRYVDGATTRLGLVRSTAVSWQRPLLRQTIKLETHILEGA